MHKISLCMIVKNEEHNLRRCLSSIQGYVHEIVIVDTGSTDDTISIAKEYLASVYRVKWEDNFSMARNLSLEKADGDWILILDADEELPRETAEQIRVLVTQVDVEAWTFSVVSLGKDGDKETGTRHPGLRLFRNKEEYRFQGLVHEQILPSILKGVKEEEGEPVRDSNLDIFHYGYIDGARRQKATERNIRLLKKELQRTPCNSYANFNMATSLHTSGAFKDALDYYKLSLQYAGTDIGKHVPVLYRNYASCLVDYGEFVRALELIDEGLVLYPDYPELHCLMGQVYLETGLYDHSRKWYSHCLQFSDVSPDYVITQGVTGDLARENLALSCFMLGLYDEAVHHLVRLNLKKQFMPKELCLSLKELGISPAPFFEEQLDLTLSQVVALLFAAGEYMECLDYLDRCHNCEEMMLYRLQCMNRLGICISQQLIHALVAYTKTEENICKDVLRQIYIAKWINNIEPGYNVEQLLCNHKFMQAYCGCYKAWKIIDSVLSSEDEMFVDLPSDSDVYQESLKVICEMLKLDKIDQAAIVVSIFFRPDYADEFDLTQVLLETGRIAQDNHMVLQANRLFDMAYRHGEINDFRRNIALELAKSYVLLEDYNNALEIMTWLVSQFPHVQEFVVYQLIALAGCEKGIAMALHKAKPDKTTLRLLLSLAGRIKKLRLFNEVIQ